MAPNAYVQTPLTSSLEWIRNFVREELSPYPGRGSKVARKVIATTVVMLVNMTFKVPYGAYSALYALMISRESGEATLEETRITVSSFACATLYALISVMCVADSPLLRLLWIIGTLFLVFFAMSAIDYHAAVRFGYLLVIVIPLWDRQTSAEQKVVNTLWAAFALSFASIVTAIIEISHARLFPLSNLTGELVERLRQVASLLRSAARGAENTKAKRQVAHFAVLGTSRLRRDLIRSDHWPETADKMGAMVALIGRLVDLVANASHLSDSLPKELCPGTEKLASRIETLADRLLDQDTVLSLDRFEDLDLCNALPLFREIKKTVRLIEEVLADSEIQEKYSPPPKRDQPTKRFLAADAFSNPEHVRFAIRGGLAASACYLTYNLIALPEINTAVTTCLLTALSTVGASRQKQILRFGGAVVGGVILGFGSQIYILPALDSITGFTVLFTIVTFIAAWISTSGPRLSYFGVQIALAFYLINLQEFKFQTSLAVARDRVVGIMLGLLAMWFIFDQLWSVSAVAEMQRTFVLTLRLVAKLMRAPVAQDPDAAREETYSLRETIDASFEKLRQHADGVMLEFGKSRERNLALRTRLLQWQLQLRILFLTRVALLQYRLRSPGFELPEWMLQSEQKAEAVDARRLENLADIAAGKLLISAAVPDNSATAPQDQYQGQLSIPNIAAFPSLRSFVALRSRGESLLSSLEKEVASTTSIQSF
jgi:multidrug resistance protein MdtO